MKLAIVSDEISKDFKTAVEYGKKWKIYDFEIRELNSGRIPYIDIDELRDVINLKKDNKINFTAISPGLFKVPLTEKETIDFQRKKAIFDTMKIADKFKTNKIIIFGIERYENEPEKNLQYVLDIMGEMSIIAQKYGFLICVENEAGHWFDSGENSAKILKEVDSEYLKANWDPGNALLSGETPFPEGYRFIKNYISNLHIKDYKKNEKDEYEAVPAGEGVINWEGQLKSVVKDLNLENITIETHCTPLIEKSEKSINNIR
ncbi:hypothetical protein DRQ09_09610, partial [candidate division KSB1 bacterium]